MEECVHARSGLAVRKELQLQNGKLLYKRNRDFRYFHYQSTVEEFIANFTLLNNSKFRSVDANILVRGHLQRIHGNDLRDGFIFAIILGLRSRLRAAGLSLHESLLCGLHTGAALPGNFLKSPSYLYVSGLFARSQPQT